MARREAVSKWLEKVVGKKTWEDIEECCSTFLVDKLARLARLCREQGTTGQHC